MAHSSKGEAKSVGPSICDYINGLRGEFALLSNPTSTKSPRPSRFNVYLSGLEGEFELLKVEIKSLREERDGFEAKVEAQAKELQKVRGNSFCERCSKETTSVSQTVAPFLKKTIKTALSLFSGPFFQSASGTSRGVDMIPSPLSTADPEQSDWSIEFNNQVEKEVDVEMAHVLFHGNRVNHVRFSRDGRYLAAACHDGKANIYDVESGTLTYVLENLLAKQDYISHVSFSHDGKYLATISSEGLFIWDIKKKHVRNSFKGHNLLISSLDFSPNGRLLVSASYDKTVRLWNMRYGVVKVFVADAYYYSACFSPDGHCVAASNNDGVVRIWDVCTGRLMRRLKKSTTTAIGVMFMPDGKGLLSLRSGNSLEYWDVSSLDATNSSARSHTVDDPQRPEREFSGHTRRVTSFSISPGGRWVATGSYDRSVRISDTRTTALQCTINHGDTITTVDFSPSGRHLASAGIDGAVRIWRYSGDMDP